MPKRKDVVKFIIECIIIFSIIAVALLSWIPFRKVTYEEMNGVKFDRLFI